MFQYVKLSGDIYMYADDTLSISKSNNIEEVTEKCSKGLDKVSTWCEANKLSMNYKKTKYMIIKHKKTSDVPIVLRQKMSTWVSFIHIHI